MDLNNITKLNNTLLNSIPFGNKMLELIPLLLDEENKKIYFNKENDFKICFNLYSVKVLYVALADNLEILYKNGIRNHVRPVLELLFRVCNDNNKKNTYQYYDENSVNIKYHVYFNLEEYEDIVMHTNNSNIDKLIIMIKNIVSLINDSNAPYEQNYFKTYSLAELNTKCGLLLHSSQKFDENSTFSELEKYNNGTGDERLTLRLMYKYNDKEYSISDNIPTFSNKDLQLNTKLYNVFLSRQHEKMFMSYINKINVSYNLGDRYNIIANDITMDGADITDFYFKLSFWANRKAMNSKQSEPYNILSFGCNSKVRLDRTSSIIHDTGRKLLVKYVGPYDMGTGNDISNIFTMEKNENFFFEFNILRFKSDIKELFEIEKELKNNNLDNLFNYKLENSTSELGGC